MEPVYLDILFNECQYNALVKKINFNSIFQGEQEIVETEGEELIALYLFDVTELVKYKKANEEQKLVELMAMHQEKLMSTLSNDDLDSFKKFVECSEEYSSVIEAQAFEIGFKLGVKFFEEI